ncbi:hypothetical protein AAKU52_002633 [Pedobacter sp. CG_S7]|uniref:hypothetical protein n=1 Tax=Pedobacter sp. CG_S7 TaxID=3143930 RepID=UPI003394FABE
MKNLSIAVILVFAFCSVNGQTYDEIMRQKKTYRKYNLQNIANNQIYLQVLKQGYGIYKDGTNTWNNLRKGEFGFHTTYFNSLKAVSPGVAKYPKIKGCGDLQSAIMKEYTRGKKDFSTNKNLDTKEKKYVEGVYTNLMEECSKAIDELEMVVTSNKIEMTDDQRIKVIDKVYEGYQDKYSFIVSFNNSTRMLCLSRARDKGDTGTLKGLYN